MHSRLLSHLSAFHGPGGHKLERKLVIVNSLGLKSLSAGGMFGQLHHGFSHREDCATQGPYY